ncbi:hypothetical protein V2J09_004228 [Rumex salicifolius]
METEKDKQWRLYEAYNELHALAQGFETPPFEAPAVLVVGHQTDGKSALVEALMGFQFNHVGGGTKTRRPITLHMKFNPDSEDPLCFLLVSDSLSDSSLALPKSLLEIQSYIEAENRRLESDPCQFSSKEIIIRVEYKYCPNLTIIDTPGLIAPAPGRKNKALQSQSRAVESLVRAKMQHKEFIILCLEDCSDWSNATTRRIVMQIDPELSRTVIVSTKLDTKIPQFACSSDVEVFLSPPACTLDGFLLGGSPFFTSVPSGRVGAGHESVFRSNDDFKQAISYREKEDIASLEEKLGRLLSMQERSRIGVSSLRKFLEEQLQKSSLDEVKLKEKGRNFHDMFLTKLSLLLKGSIVAPPDKFGETLQDERVNGGALMGPDGLQFPQKLIPNAGMRLYGGAQYHRAMAEFRFVVGGTKCPQITREEIVNACGVEDIHDGTNYSRTACVIAVAKARDTFEPFLHQLWEKIRRILLIVLLFDAVGIQAFAYTQEASACLCSPFASISSYPEVIQDAPENFPSNMLSMTYNLFMTERRCMEDLVSTTRYVTWSLHNKNRVGLRHFLDSFGATEQSMASATSLAGVVPQESSQGSAVNDKHDHKPKPDLKPGSSVSAADSGGVVHTTEMRLADLLDSTLWNRRLAPSSERIVHALVHQIFHGIKEYFLASAELKFNCFLLMPVVDKLPALLRKDLELAFEDDLDTIFDISSLTSSLGKQKQDTEIELKRIRKIKEKFRHLHAQLFHEKLLGNMNI